jgi:hypothetical protein
LVRGHIVYRLVIVERRLLKMIFSVDVNMYREKVTSYWYFLICSHRTSDERNDVEWASPLRSFGSRAYSGMVVVVEMDDVVFCRAMWSVRVARVG